MNFLRKIMLGLPLLAVWAMPAHADSALTVAVCDSQTLSLNTQLTLTLSPGGSLCVKGIVTLGAGTAIFGKVDFDQTTPGTTNGVVVNNGSTGLDYSANNPTLPNIGAGFGSTGPYANYVLIKTVPASLTRANVDIENMSGAQIAIIRDDGTAANSAAPANASVFALTGGQAAGQQGGTWSSSSFKGRLQIYAASSTAQICVMVD
jgi:hypothetical protein